MGMPTPDDVATRVAALQEHILECPVCGAAAVITMQALVERFTPVLGYELAVIEASIVLADALLQGIEQDSGRSDLIVV